jgi:hypothetical protein
MPYKKVDEEEDGTELIVDLTQYKEEIDQKSAQESFKEIYSKKVGSEFFKLKLENGTVYHAGEKIKGIVEYKSDINSKPIIIIKGYKMVSFETNVKQILSF